MTGASEQEFDEALDAVRVLHENEMSRVYEEGFNRGVDFTVAVMRNEFGQLVNNERNGNAAYGISRAIERIKNELKTKESS